MEKKIKDLRLEIDRHLSTIAQEHSCHAVLRKINEPQSQLHPKLTNRLVGNDL